MNWASSFLGGKIVSFSSQLPGCEASHILDDDFSKIWLSEGGVPQWLCISLAEAPNLEDIEVRTVGWHCWHAYSTNPKEVRLHVSKDGTKFRVWDSFVASCERGTQLFCTTSISAELYPFIAFEIVSTFGGTQTYLNRIFLFADEMAGSFISSLPFPDEGQHEEKDLYKSIDSGHDFKQILGLEEQYSENSSQSDFNPNHDTFEVAHQSEEEFAVQQWHPPHPSSYEPEEHTQPQQQVQPIEQAPAHPSDERLQHLEQRLSAIADLLSAKISAATATATTTMTTAASIATNAASAASSVSAPTAAAAPATAPVVTSSDAYAPAAVETEPRSLFQSPLNGFDSNTGSFSRQSAHWLREARGASSISYKDYYPQASSTACPPPPKTPSQTSIASILSKLRLQSNQSVDQLLAYTKQPIHDLPADSEEDIAELVRQLHSRVLLRTIREAQLKLVQAKRYSNNEESHMHG